MAYLGRKSRYNPYTGFQYGWARGAPNVFGGNWQGSIDETLYRETREESRTKVDLNQLNLGQKVLIHQANDPNGVTMMFYAIQGNFTYNAAPYFPTILRNRAEYRECYR